MANTYNEAGFAYNDALSAYNSLAPVPTVWPTIPLALRVDLQLGGVWTNVTGDVYAAERINIVRGRPDEASSAQASQATLVLNNRTGKYTPKNPMGAYYGQIGRNTPIRIGIGIPPNGTATGNQVASTNIVAPAVAAESSGVVISMYAQQSNAATITVPVSYNASPLMGGLSPTGLSSRMGYVAVSSAGTVAASTATSSVSAPGAAATLFLPGATTAGGLLSTVSGQYSFTQNAFGPNATSSPIAVSAGDVLVAMVAWSSDTRNAMITAPIDNSQSAEWTLVADSGPSSGPRVQAWARYCPVADSLTVQAPGECYGGNDTQLGLIRLSGAATWNPRYTGACADFSTTADLSGNDVRTAISAGQVLRQRGQGQQASNSCLYRYITDKSPLAYWPLESGALGGVFNSPIAGVSPARPFAVTPGADSASFVASDSLPQTAVNGSIACTVPNYAAAASGQAGSVFFVANITGTGINPCTFFSIKLQNDGTAATISSIALQYVDPLTMNLVLVNGTGASSGAIFNSVAIRIPTTGGATSGGSLTGVPLGWFLAWNPNPTNPTTQTDYRIGAVTANGVAATGGNPGVVGTCGQVYQVGAALDQYLSNTMNTVCTFGHILFDPYAYNVGSAGGLFPPTRVFPNVHCTDIVGGFPSEPLSLRIRRVCQDESIFLSSPILSSESTDTANVRHGPQPISDGLGLITLAQTTDGGELAEARGFNGFLYRPLAALCSRPTVQVVDYAARMIADPFAPADDDQLIRNDVTVSQLNGSSARSTLPAGTLSTQPPPNGVGTYTSSLSVDAAQQNRDLQQIASWALAQGTYDAPRFKEVRSLLEAVPGSATMLSLIDVGNHIQIANTPTWVQSGPSDLIVIGLREVIGTVAEWEITYTGRPYGPFNVLRADAAVVFGGLDSGSSTLASGATSGATSLSVATSNSSDLWTTSPPPGLQIAVAGEVMTVTAIAGASSPQTFTVTRAANGVVKAQTAGASVHIYPPAYLGLNGGS